MATVFQRTDTVGEIVAAFPGASNLFKTHGIDFCCGGGRSLAAALARKGIPEALFFRQLQEAYDETQRRQAPAEMDWREAPLGALIDRIMRVHHAYLKQELPMLGALVTKICLEHGELHPELVTLGPLFQQLRTELEPHMAAEEDELFPRILAYTQTSSPADLAPVIESLDRLENGHQEASRLLAAMRELTRNYRLPADACRTYKLTFAKLVDLESDMFMHVHLENNILFPRLRRAAALQA